MHFDMLLFLLTKFCCRLHSPVPCHSIEINEFLGTKRRAIWNLLRVEWENIKQQKAQVEKDEQAGDDDEEKSAFLPPAAAALPMTVPAKRPNSGS